MSEYYGKINLQISSGGGALEAAYLGIPQVLIPFKHGTILPPAFECSILR